MSQPSFTSIFDKVTPKLNGVEFDAVIQEGAELTAESTDYPLEDGSINQDHIVSLPLKLNMTIAGSNTPVARTLTDTARDTGLGAASNALPGSVLAGVSGIASALNTIGDNQRNIAQASGSNTSRCVTLWDELYKMMTERQVFDVVHTLKVYKNMHFTSLSYERTEEDENILIIHAELKQITTVKSRGSSQKVLTEAGTDIAKQAQDRSELGFVGKALSQFGVSL